MRAATVGFVLAVLLIGCRAHPNLWADVNQHDNHDRALDDNNNDALDNVGDSRRAKIQLHLDKDNPNDKDFVEDFAGLLTHFRDVKLEKEHVALRDNALLQNELAKQEAAKLVAEKLVQLLLDNPKSNQVAVRENQPRAYVLRYADDQSDEDSQSPSAARCRGSQ